MMLKDAIGGNCRTCIIVTLANPSDPEFADDPSSALAHSFKTCAFARLARGVRNAPRENRTFEPGNLLNILKAQVPIVASLRFVRKLHECHVAGGGADVSREEPRRCDRHPAHCCGRG
jgi:hypothetical protein